MRVAAADGPSNPSALSERHTGLLRRLYPHALAVGVEMATAGDDAAHEVESSAVVRLEGWVLGSAACAPLSAALPSAAAASQQVSSHGPKNRKEKQSKRKNEKSDGLGVVVVYVV